MKNKKNYNRPHIQGKKKIVDIEKDKAEAQYLIEIDQMIASRSQFFSKYLNIRDAYRKPYDTPQLDPLRHEICLCLCFGLDQAAVTLTNHLLESFLKYCLFFYLSRPERNPQVANSPEAMVEAFEEAQDQIDNLTLAQSINKARSLRILTKEETKDLIEIKKTLRDPYSHASKKNLLGKGKIPVMPATLGQDYSINPLEQVHVDVALNPLVNWYAQLQHARKMALPYFRYIDDLIRKILERMEVTSPPPTMLL